MKDSILFIDNCAVKVIHSMQNQSSSLKNALYPFFLMNEGTLCVVDTLYMRTKRLQVGYSSIEHYYTYHHVSLMMCGVFDSYGIYVWIVGEKACLYVLRNDSVIKYRRFVKIRRLSIYKNRVYIQLEHGMTLITIEGVFDDQMDEYLVGKMLVSIERVFGESWSVLFERAVGRY